MMTTARSGFFSWRLVCTFLLIAISGTYGRPVVRSIKSTHEFDRLLKKHSTETGLPVVVDFYSDSCGPCRMMAPIFKKVAADYVDKAVFVKIDTNAQYELSSRYQIRSLPTFQWFVSGTRFHEAKGGIGEGPLRQTTDQAISTAAMENVKLTLDDLVEYYQDVDPSKAKDDIASVYEKCKTMKKKQKNEFCQGTAASTLVRKLKRKYKKAPKTSKLFEGVTSKKTDSESGGGSSSAGSSRSSSRGTNKSSGPNLHLASKDQLMEELERRLDEERDAQLEDEEDEDDETYWNEHKWIPGPFPERVVIVGGGPAGMAAAIYAARAGLTPLVIAPSMGGQLQGKGVDVENYPGLHNITGPAVIASMRQQAASFGAVFEEDFVTNIEAGAKKEGQEHAPFKVHTNSTGAIETHAVIIATGAESNWLGVPGEYELRGGGVSSCATCDGFLFSGKDVIIVGGGDAAMEDALVLARTSKSVTVIHRRDKFRASKVLATRVIDHPTITVRWNTVVEKVKGKTIENDGEGEEDVDLDNVQQHVAGAVLKDVVTNDQYEIDCDAVFIAIGHTPTTEFVSGLVEMDPNHPGYILTQGSTSTKTSVDGIFAAGDVSDSIYRQAITSAGSGAAAALDAERWLSEEGLGNEAAELEAELLAELQNDIHGKVDLEDTYNAYEDAGGRMSGMKESISAEL